MGEAWTGLLAACDLPKTLFLEALFRSALSPSARCGFIRQE
jgi:hypothetical protein